MILTSLMIISVLLILYSIVYRYYITNTKYLKNVPGPKPNAIFGNLLSFFGPSEGWLPQLTEFIQTFGPVVKGYYGPYKLVLMVAEEKFLKYVLCSPNFIDKSDEYIIFENWLGKGLFTSSGPKWKARRRMLAPVFHNTILMNSVDTCNRLGEIFIRKLTKEVGKESFDILPQSSLLSLDIVCETIMGISMNVQESGNLQYVHSIDTLCRILMERYSSYIHNSLYPFTLIYWRERRAIKVIDEYTNTVIDKKIEKMNSIDSEAVDNSASRKLDLLDLLLKNTEDGTSLSRNDLRDEVVAFIFGGYHTTSSAISFVMYCLGENPEVQVLMTRLLCGCKLYVNKPTSLAQLKQIIRHETEPLRSLPVNRSSEILVFD